MIGSFLPFFVFTHSTALSGRPRRKLRASCQLVSLWALHNSHSSQNEALLSDPGLIIVLPQWVSICFAYQVEVGTIFVKLVTWICQSCYRDLSKLLRGFVQDIREACIVQKAFLWTFRLQFLLTNCLKIDNLDNRQFSGPNVGVKKFFCLIALKLNHLLPKAC